MSNIKKLFFNKGLLKKYNLSFPKIKNREKVIQGGQKFKDKVVIITGASSGIGKACAFEFAEKGATVVLAARRIDKLRKIEETINNH